jgi:hypothetical protein
MDEKSIKFTPTMRMQNAIRIMEGVITDLGYKHPVAETIHGARQTLRNAIEEYEELYSGKK